MGRRSAEIETLLGFRGRDEMIHRDDLVLMRSGRACRPRRDIERAATRRLDAADGSAGRAAGGRRGAGAGVDRAQQEPRAAGGRRGDRARARRRHPRRQRARHGGRARPRGLGAAMLDRLRARCASASRRWRAGIEEIVALPDPIGSVIAEWTRPNGLRIQRVRVPLGVIGIIYESRPNVTADAGALCLKSGNAVILRGGSESVHSSARDPCLPGRRARGRGPAGRPASSWCRPPIARRSATCSPA